jgi:hypothetical protein
MSSSLTLQANLFQVFQPMGGVRARLAEGLESCAAAARANKSVMNTNIFGRMFYRKVHVVLSENDEIGKRDFVIR